MRRPKLSQEQQQELLRLRRHENINTGALAKRFCVSRGIVWRILKKFGALRPPMASKHEMEIIRQLSGKRTQCQLARFLGRSIAFVINWQAKLGCRRKHQPTEKDKQTIIDLYRGGKGKGQVAIARITGVPKVAVHRTLVAAGVTIRGGKPFQPSTRQLIDIIDLAMAGNDSAKSIAKKIGRPYRAVLKLVHKLRQCSKFLPTATIRSYLPMKYREFQIESRACEEESMMYLLDCARRACADCHLTPDPRRLVAVAIAVSAQLYLREKPEAHIGYSEQQKIVDSLTPRFTNCLDALLSAEQAVVH